MTTLSKKKIDTFPENLVSISACKFAFSIAYLGLKTVTIKFHSLMSKFRIGTVCIIQINIPLLGKTTAWQVNIKESCFSKNTSSDIDVRKGGGETVFGYKVD